MSVDEDRAIIQARMDDRDLQRRADTLARLLKTREDLRSAMGGKFTSEAYYDALQTALYDAASEERGQIEKILMKGLDSRIEQAKGAVLQRLSDQ